MSHCPQLRNGACPTHTCTPHTHTHARTRSQMRRRQQLNATRVVRHSQHHDPRAWATQCGQSLSAVTPPPPPTHTILASPVHRWPKATTSDTSASEMCMHTQSRAHTRTHNRACTGADTRTQNGKPQNECLRRIPCRGGQGSSPEPSQLPGEMSLRSDPLPMHMVPTADHKDTPFLAPARATAPTRRVLAPEGLNCVALPCRTYRPLVGH